MARSSPLSPSTELARVCLHTKCECVLLAHSRPAWRDVCCQQPDVCEKWLQPTGLVCILFNKSRFYFVLVPTLFLKETWSTTKPKENKTSAVPATTLTNTSVNLLCQLTRLCHCRLVNPLSVHISSVMCNCAPFHRPRRLPPWTTASYIGDET